MKAARLHGAGDIRLGEEPVPEPGPGMCLVRVTAVGICGSDLHWWDEGVIGDTALTAPMVLGHEAAGVIEDGPRRGERVAIDPAIWCGTCRPCRDGYRNLCTRVQFAGHGSQDGTMREFMAWPDHLLHRLPDGITDAGGRCWSRSASPSTHSTSAISGSAPPRRSSAAARSGSC